jgi:hypothetical protein
MTVLAHPLQSKASLCSLGQSSSGPRRITYSPHPLHSKTICPKASTEYSSPSPCHDSADSGKPCIPLLLLPHSASETTARTSLPSATLRFVIRPSITKHSTGVACSNGRAIASVLTHKVAVGRIRVSEKTPSQQLVNKEGVRKRRSCRGPNSRPLSGGRLHGMGCIRGLLYPNKIPLTSPNLSL